METTVCRNVTNAELRKEGIGIPQISQELGVMDRDVLDLLFDIAVVPVVDNSSSVRRITGKTANLRLAVDNDRAKK